MPQTATDDRQHPIEASVRLPSVSLVPSQSYLNRAVLATGLAIVTVAVMYGPATGSLARKVHEPTAQSGLHITAPRHVEPRETNAGSPKQVDDESSPTPASVRNTPPALSRGNLPAGATGVSSNRSVKPNAPFRRGASLHPQPPIPASVLPIPDFHQLTEPKGAPKAVYVWR
jgi:hypothetical protein